MTSYYIEYCVPIATVGKTDAQIVDEVLAAKRSKLAGGNRYNYVAWAREVSLEDESVTFATIVDLAQGEGSFDIVIMTTALDTYGVYRVSPEILAEIKALCQARRPIGSGFSWGMRVMPAVRNPVWVALAGYGREWNKKATRVAVRSYMDGLMPGQRLARSMISAIAHEYGAETAEVTQPTNDITPIWDPTTGDYGVLRAAEITVYEVEP